jgi:hypothetical protein
MNDKATRAEVLLRAADYVRQLGWTRNTLQEPDGRVCVMGAINCAVLNSTTARKPLFERLDFISDLASDVSRTATGYCDTGGLVDWNDTVATSAEEVILVLEQTAANLKADA